LRIEQATLKAYGATLVWITPLYLAFQVLILAQCALLVNRLAVPLPQSAAVLLAVAAVLAYLTHSHPLLAYPYSIRWCAALAVLLLLTSVLLPLAERHLTWIAPPPLMRVLWGITILACGVRLAGSLHPLFEAFDLGLNVGRFIKTLSGELVVTSRSIEFRNNITVYPPGAYLVLLPGALLHIPPPLLIQGSLALIDGFGALTTAALARLLGANGRTAIFSALAYAAIPIHLTALWFGLTAQIFGQALMAPLAIALLVALRTDRKAAWLAVGLILTMALLTHIGIAVTVIAWLGLVWLLLLWQRAVSPGVWWRFAWVVALSCLVSFASIYSAVAVLKIQQMLLTVEKIQTSGYAPAYNLIVDSFPVSFGMLGLLLILPGLLLLWQRRLLRVVPPLVMGWLLTMVFFLGIELVSALQVRYLYFIVPLACLAMGLVLDALARRNRAGHALAWAVLLLMLAQNGAAWYGAAAEDAMMSMIPLLR
jgi:hypothetical protein